MSSQTVVSAGGASGGGPLYEKFFLQDLKISKDFLEKYHKVIRDRLERAADEFESDHGNIFAINMCLHAATSIILSHPEYLKDTQELVRKTVGLTASDPTTVLTVGTLYYLIDWDSRRAASQRQTAVSKTKSDEAVLQEGKLKRLRRGLDKINWLIGEDAMSVLGMSKLD